ncbi:hypothetical protein F5X99DRAFT_418521 [Biscogniauxia marginata]|nr:hypothetical protein F5X99DRAFT_418521 [Biscogniauxia marginata]
MAFHQPTRQPTQRVFRPSPEHEESLQAPRPALQPVEDSQTWVLFSPATDAGTTTTSYLTESNRSNITPGRSRFSDLGSLNTVGRTEASVGPQNSGSLVDAVDEDDEDAELDSLDSHLPGFRATPDFYNSSPPLPHSLPVVPAHDGYGSFRLEQEGMGPEVQDRLYAFEKYNPRRVKRRRESLEMAQAELENGLPHEMDKMRRIESWRLEQSQYLLEEIRKETRRRRRSVATASSVRPAEKKAEDVVTPNTAARDSTCDGADQGEDWHDRHANEYGDECNSTWGRITRKVIRDILGIDDKLLAILFGEELPDDEYLSATPTASTWQRGDVAMESSTDSSWHFKMLERVAKELGNLVHHLSGHPGAFSTYTRVQQMPLPYAGLPPIPETTNYPAPASPMNEGPSAIPEFQPTIKTRTRPADVPQGRPSSAAAQSKSQLPGESAGANFTQDEWEQDLDARLVFRYLRSRFLPRTNSAGGFSTNSHATASSTQDLAAKVARVRQNHPLVCRSRPVERRKSKTTTPSSPGLYRHGSSCASQSTRRSVRRSSASSSRHYWDIGGSVGTGSMIATIGPMGSWGEV